MNYRALDINGVTVDFSISDGPAKISDTRFVLTGREFSAALYTDTIMRRDERLNIAEGDIVYYGEDKIGYVIFEKGFRMLQLSDGKIVDLPLLRYARYVRGNRESRNKISADERRAYFAFKFENKYIFQLNNVVRVKQKDESIFVSQDGKEIYSVNVKDTKDFTGCRDDEGNMLFVNDKYRGGIVKLWRGVPVVKMPNGKLKKLP